MSCRQQRARRAKEMPPVTSRRTALRVSVAAVSNSAAGRLPAGMPARVTEHAATVARLHIHNIDI
jgi:anti-sigma factor RsiW